MGRECTICYEPIKYIFGKRGAKASCCNFWYHNVCLKEWYLLSNRCPSCRTVRQRHFRLGQSEVLLTEDCFIWKNTHRQMVVNYADIAYIDTVTQLNKVIMRVQLTDCWASYSFSLSAPQLLVHKIYDGIKRYC